MSSICSSPRCLRPSVFHCYSCRKNYCSEHSKEHDAKLHLELNPLVDETKSLTSRYKNLNASKLLKQARVKLDQWRTNCLKRIEQLYEEKSKEIADDWTPKFLQPPKDIERIQTKLNQLIKKQKVTHEDIYQSKDTIRSIEQAINDIQMKGVQLDMHRPTKPPEPIPLHQPVAEQLPPQAMVPELVPDQQIQPPNPPMVETRFISAKLPPPAPPSAPPPPPVISAEEVKRPERKFEQVQHDPSSHMREVRISNANLYNLSSPYRTMECSNQSGVALTGSSQHLLIYEHENFILFNRDLIPIKQSTWTQGNIYDICYSPALKKFLFITDKRTIYRMDENTLQIQAIQSIEQNKWWSCTTSERSLFLSTYGTDMNIYLFDLTSSFYLIKRWKSLETWEQNEYIHHINYSNQTLAILIGNSITKTARMELRSSSTLEEYWAFSFDMNQISYQSNIRSCSLQAQEWLIIIENTSKLIHIDQYGNLKIIYPYKYPVWNAFLFDQHFLTIRTDRAILFH